MTWKELACELLQMPEEVHLSHDLVATLEAVLRDAGRFFEVDLGPGDERWPDFVELQKVTKMGRKKAGETCGERAPSFVCD